MKHQGLSLRGLCGRFTLLVCLVSLLALLLGSGSSTAGQGQGKFLSQASERLAGLIGKANSDGYQLANNKFAIGGGWLKQGKEWGPLYTITLEKGKSYRVLAAGDNDAQDVDVQILDPNDKEMAVDTAKAAEASVDFSPKVTQKYLVRVRVYASQNNRPSLCLGVVMVK